MNITHSCHRYKLWSCFLFVGDTYRYENVWMGMLMMITGQDLSQMLLMEVKYIDHVEVEGTLRLANIPNVTEFKPLSWGLDRIDHQPNQALLNQIYTVIGGGDNVHVYVVDTVLFLVLHWLLTSSTPSMHVYKEQLIITI